MELQYYYQYYNLEREHWWFRVREKIIKERIAKTINGKNNLDILNIGSATGRSSEMLQAFGNVTSLEYEPECIEFIKEKTGEEVLQGSITALPFEDQAFDLVCAFDVIEHVEDDEKAAEEMQRVCKEGGNIVVTVPAFMSLWSSHDEVNHHYRRYRAGSLKQLFQDQGVGIQYCSYFNSLMFLPLWLMRVGSRLFKSEDKVDKNLESNFDKFSGKFLNKILYRIFDLERYWLKVGKFPLGVSILLIVGK